MLSDETAIQIMRHINMRHWLPVGANFHDQIFFPPARVFIFPPIIVEYLSHRKQNTIVSLGADTIFVRNS